MTEERSVKCPGCSEYFKRSKTQFIHYKSRYWHLNCYEKHAKNTLSRIELLKYIEQLLHKKIDYKINSQLNNYINNKKYKYQDIYNALYYFYEIKNNSIAKANGGIGIVPYVIDEAQAYFKHKEQMLKQAQSVELILDTKYIVINDPIKKEKYKENRHINIQQL